MSDAHAVVLPSEYLGASSLAPSRARRAVRQFLAPLELGHCEDDVLLVVSELVTNVVAHTGDAPSLMVRHHDGRLTVEVHDPSPVLPAQLAADPARVGGWGLGLVSRLTRDWGIRGVDGGGKAVWAEFELV